MRLRLATFSDRKRRTSHDESWRIPFAAGWKRTGLPSLPVILTEPSPSLKRLESNELHAAPRPTDVCRRAGRPSPDATSGGRNISYRVRRRASLRRFELDAVAGVDSREGAVSQQG